MSRFTDALRVLFGRAAVLPTGPQRKSVSATGKRTVRVTTDMKHPLPVKVVDPVRTIPQTAAPAPSLSPIVSETIRSAKESREALEKELEANHFGESVRTEMSRGRRPRKPASA